MILNLNNSLLMYQKYLIHITLYSYHQIQRTILANKIACITFQIQYTEILTVKYNFTSTRSSFVIVDKMGNLINHPNTLELIFRKFLCCMTYSITHYTQMVMMHLCDILCSTSHLYFHRYSY